MTPRFVGCPALGPRVSEVTWMGTGDRVPRPLQLAVAAAFLEGHRRRLGSRCARFREPDEAPQVGYPGPLVLSA